MTGDPPAPVVVDKLRLGVMSKDGQSMSAQWVAWERGDDFYIGVKGLTGRCKISLHASGMCRFAFDESYVPRLSNPDGPPRDRATTKWRRPDTPETGAVPVLSLVFPTDFLRARGPIRKARKGKPELWVNAAPPGHATELAFYYTRESPPDLFRDVPRFGLFLSATSLPSGEHVVLCAKSRPFNPRVVSGLPQGQVQPLSDTLGQLAPGEALDGLAGWIVNDPEKDGHLIVVDLYGLTATRSPVPGVSGRGRRCRRNSGRRRRRRRRLGGARRRDRRWGIEPRHGGLL